MTNPDTLDVGDRAQRTGREDPHNPGPAHPRSFGLLPPIVFPSTDRARVTTSAGTALPKRIAGGGLRDERVRIL